MFSVLRNGREMAGLKKSTKISKTTNAYGQQIVKKVTTVVHEDGSRTIT